MKKLSTMLKSELWTSIVILSLVCVVGCPTPASAKAKWLFVGQCTTTGGTVKITQNGVTDTYTYSTGGAAGVGWISPGATTATPGPITAVAGATYAFGVPVGGWVKVSPVGGAADPVGANHSASTESRRRCSRYPGGLR